MNIGDKVRLLRAKEQGVVTRFLEGQLVEVEIEDGFKIPVLRSELAVVSADESRMFKQPSGIEARKPDTRVSTGIFASSGVYMAFVSVNDREMSQYLINNTDWDLPFTFGEEADQRYKGVIAGVLKSKTSLKVQEVVVAQFEAWPVYVFNAFFHREGNHTPKMPLTKKVRFRANTFFKSKQAAPLLNRDAHLLQLDLETVDIKPEQLQEKLSNNILPIQPKSTVIQPNAVVDLHIEKLTQHESRLNNAEKLQLQLQTFETQLENAIASGMKDIIFIHGVGNGTLRAELQKRISKHPHIQFYEDAQKEKFGYGATKIKFK